MDHYPPPPPLHTSAPPTPGNGNRETGHVAVHPPPPPPTALARGLPVSQQQLGGEHDLDPNALLVGATLITMLAYLLGTFIPGGYWQQDWSDDGKRVLYRAGDPIMRDLHRPRYCVFRIASWVGVASSMVMTLSLLVRMAPDSRHVRWSFAVSYSSLLLTFAVSQTKTHLSVDIIVWLAVLVVSWLITSTGRIRGANRARIMKLFCCSSGDS
ncbi:hypothetical protein SETIT_9G465200v2 [Setaria italica]|uniref:PGG domain-containing protein n=1 Tax=Setaria italica TaxID=4555 RepID=K4ALX6_SETIT|nr:uncharacterized protein LOC101783369 [Setaria italica]RCV45570.1 hypothetical protein SETIT_9G465200v2 [Setaria italica]